MGQKYWRGEGNEIYSLYFAPFGEYERIAEVCHEDDGGWYFSSSTLNASDEYLGSDNAIDAKGEAEARILEYYLEQRDHYSTLANQFEEAVKNG